jgi:hypothetical protein
VGDLGIDKGIISNWFLKKYDVKVWTVTLLLDYGVPSKVLEFLDKLKCC